MKPPCPHRGSRAGAVLALALAAQPARRGQDAGLGAAGELVDPDVLRVCADPSNMPFSDESGKGFENKLAELVAAKTGRKSVAYTWFPMVTGFVRNTLRANRCDVIMGYAQGDELVQNTNAYYRSTYVLVYQEGQRSRWRRDDRGSAARRQAHRRGPGHAAGFQHGRAPG